MTIFKHELRQNRIALIIWTGAIAVLLGVCILIYPDMADQMGDISTMFADMGSFSQAFGMDRINFGEFIGFFGVECGNVLGLGGAFFAALTGITILAKEEKEHTAEFLLTHPISRARVVLEKLLAVVTQVVILNVCVVLVTATSVWFIGEEVEVKTLALLFLAYFLMQLEVAAITFGISAFLRQSGMGIGLGMAALFYCLNLVANMAESAEFLKYITPFGYTEGADIIAEGKMNEAYLLVGMIITVVAVLAAFVNYTRKDIS